MGRWGGRGVPFEYVDDSATTRGREPAPLETEGGPREEIEPLCTGSEYLDTGLSSTTSSSRSWRSRSAESPERPESPEPPESVVIGAGRVPLEIWSPGTRPLSPLAGKRTLRGDDSVDMARARVGGRGWLLVGKNGGWRQRVSRKATGGSNGVVGGHDEPCPSGDGNGPVVEFGGCPQFAIVPAQAPSPKACCCS